jgi:hypothetical protein
MNDVYIKDGTLMIPLSGETADSIVVGALKDSREFVRQEFHRTLASAGQYDEFPPFLEEDIKEMHSLLISFNRVLEYYGC